jgi:epsilon-lactone hydrolase
MASWQADVVSIFIRMIVKRRPEGDEADVVKFIRSRLAGPQFLRYFIAPVDTRSVSAVKDGPVKGEWLRASGEPRRTVYYLHGGGYVACSPFRARLSSCARTSLPSRGRRRRRGLSLAARSRR